MALVKTVNEVKEVLPKLVSNLNQDSMLPNFDAVEQKYLVPIIGQQLYADLQTKYNANSLSNDEQALVKHMRLLVVSYGFMDEQAASHVFFTDDGIRVASTGDMQKAVGWEYKELKKFLQDRALDGTEVLLTYMWQKKDDLPLWRESVAFKQFEGLLFKSGTEFDGCYGLYQPMRTYYAIRAIVENAQNYYLQTGIGATLLNYLVKKGEPTEKESAAIRELKKALAYFSIKHAGEHYPVRFSDSGFTVVSEFGGDRESEDSGRSGANISLIQMKLKACDRDGKNFMLRAKRMLCDLRKDVTATPEFIEAFDIGPLKSYLDPTERTSGNEKRRIFRF